jgi:hypothetical protein
LQQELIDIKLHYEKMIQKEMIIEEIIIKHRNLNLDLQKKDKFVAEVLLLAFFYDKIRCLYRDRFNLVYDNNFLTEINFEEISSLLEYCKNKFLYLS